MSHAIKAAQLAAHKTKLADDAAAEIAAITAIEAGVANNVDAAAWDTLQRNFVTATAAGSARQNFLKDCAPALNNDAVSWADFDDGGQDTGGP